MDNQIKTYIVFEDKGSWDSYTYKILHVFLSKEKAEKYKDEYEASIKAKIVPCPFPVDEDGDLDEVFEASMTKKQNAEYRDWRHKNFEAVEFNKCVIEEWWAE